MKECTYCGWHYPDTADKCPGCGTAYDEKAKRIHPQFLELGHSNGFKVAESPSGMRGVGLADALRGLSFRPCTVSGVSGYAVVGEFNVPDDVVIPEEYNGALVLAIGKRGFAGRRIQTIQLPSTLRQINEEAFRDCVCLSEITGGDGLDFLGENAFRGCIRLEHFQALKNPRLSAFSSTFAGCYHLPLYTPK